MPKVGEAFCPDHPMIHVKMDGEAFRCNVGGCEWGAPLVLTAEEAGQIIKDFAHRIRNSR